MSDEFYGFDLSLQALAKEGCVAGLRLSDCDLRGPALVRLGDGLLLAGGVTVAEEQAQALLLLAPSEIPPPEALLLDGCYLENCRFHELRFIGSAEVLEATFRNAVFGPAQQPLRPLAREGRTDVRPSHGKRG